MRPELVTKWRERLPPPFDKPLQRCCSLEQLPGPQAQDAPARSPNASQGQRPSLRRRKSADVALEASDRRIPWTNSTKQERDKRRIDGVKVARQKLRRMFPAIATDDLNCVPSRTAQPADTEPGDVLRERDSRSSDRTFACYDTDDLTHEELVELASHCFPSIRDVPVIITDYSKTKCRVSRYTLHEILESDYLLEPPISSEEVRWIFVEYYKLGTFWGSDVRFLQWGTDPAIFEGSPIPLLQERLSEMDKVTGRTPTQQDEPPGYKRIGKYYRENPGCPEYLGLRANSTKWIQDEDIQLLLKYLEHNPALAKQLQCRDDNELRLGLAYIRARETMISNTHSAKDGYREIGQMLQQKGEHLLGSWDDHVERLEFYRGHTLLSCGSPRLYQVVAEKLASSDDPLRQNPDTALLYYILARVSIENDEMMQDAPERALNKLFRTLKSRTDTRRNHVETLFSLQQVISDQVEYIEENKRELLIWGIPPFPNHQIRFHENHSPPANICHLINAEMKLISEDFRTVLQHWDTLKRKVGRHLDLLIQLRVLDQQDLAVAQSQIAVSQQQLALEEAKTARSQSRSVFIFTAITVVFLPLSFFTSYFSMDVATILESSYNSRYFWAISGPISVFIILSVFAVARYASRAKVLDVEAGNFGQTTHSAPRSSSWGIWKVRSKAKVS